MIANTAKETMLRGEPVFGYTLGMGSVLSAELLSRCGVDFLLVDTQHGSWGPDSTIMALAGIAGGRATPMARVAANNFTMIGRLLDEGALGIVVPMVQTAEDAAAAAAACRYPPKGARSYGWGRARAYGDDYPEWVDDQVFLAVQIETAMAVENAEAIMAVPGVDGCWIGPADLALSLGFPPREALQRDEHLAATERVVRACRSTGKIPGISAFSVEDAINRAKQGFQFITAGGDHHLLKGGAAAGVAKLRAAGYRLRA